MDEAIERFALFAAHPHGGISLFDGVLSAAVGKPAGVAQQIAKRHRSAGSTSLEGRLVSGYPNGQFLPFGYDAMDGVVELKVALFVELHKRNGRDRFAHGVDAENGVIGDGNFALSVCFPERLEVSWVAMPRDQGLTPDEFSRGNVIAVKMIGNPC